MTVDMNKIAATHHILFITLDALRYDVASQAFNKGLLANFSAILPAEGWEKRHTPGNFTFSAHQAFFAGFLPTPVDNARAPRLFATRFAGSETTTTATLVFDQADIVSGLKAKGFHTLCIGGVGFFNGQSALGQVLPGLFEQSFWQSSFGVTDRNSACNQFSFAASKIREFGVHGKTFLFINISAIHQPNYHYLRVAGPDDLSTHEAALLDVDKNLPLLLDAYKDVGPVFGIICSDHGTAYGEDGFRGHRLNHPTVLNVPYMEFIQ